MNDALTWHSKHWQVIDSYQTHAKLAHAILLSGRAGLGKSIFAHALAKRILCQASQPPTHAACQPNSPDACASCRLFSSETNPDLLFIKPSPPADQILLEDVLATKDFLQTTSHLGGAKVCVIHEAERMNVNSANAMLKIIEEPPPNKFLLLTSSNSKLLLLTIKSRCVNLNFSPPPAETTLAWLKQNLQEELAKLPADALQDDMLFAMNADAPFAIEEMIKSGKAAALFKLHKSLQAGQGLDKLKDDYKELEPVEILDLLIWHTEKRIKQSFKDANAGKMLRALFRARLVFLNRRSMLLSKFNLNRELLLSECFALMFNSVAP